jgi:uncharacterized ion transporter superfamily protein YfcC
VNTCLEGSNPSFSVPEGPAPGGVLSGPPFDHLIRVMLEPMPGRNHHSMPDDGATTAAQESAVTPGPDEPAEQGGGFRLPSAYTILFALIVLAAIATWVIPAGVYNQNATTGEPIPGTYHEIASHPAKILTDSLTAPLNGLYGIEDAAGNINYYNSGSLFGAVDIAIFIIVIGGFLGVTMKTGAIQAGIGSLVEKMHGRERWMIPALMGVFALGGTSFGMAEESLAFYALVITVMITAGYDALTGAAIVLLGCGIGVLGSTVNPFATGIASGIAGVPISEGIVGRLVILLVGLVIGIFFVLRYADRVKKDPSKSLVYELKAANEAHFRGETDGGPAMSGTQKAILALFGLAFLVMVYGVVPWSDIGIPFPTWWWWFPEMTASFLLFAIIIGLVGRMSESDLTGSFVDGARDLLGVALIIGIARGITVIMNNGKITDTILHWIEKALGGTGAVAFLIIMFLLFLPLSFVIPSTSGLATLAMPIMVPLAGFLGVSAALVVTSYQSAAGVMNLVVPTSAVVMGGLAIARVPYGTYLRWVWPLLVLLSGLSIVVLAISAAI